MGCTYSVQMLHVPLATLKQPVAVLDARHCAPHPITLADRDPYSYYKRTFYDAASRDSVRFQTMNEKRLLIFASRRQWLLDSNQSAIANYKHTSSYDGLAIHPGSEFTGEPHFEVFAQYTPGNKSDVRVNFRDVVSDQQCRLSFEGDWGNRDAILWLDRGETGERVAVAKIYEPSDDNTPVGAPRVYYYVDIATNMDAALVLLVCIALLNSEQQYKSD